MESIYRDTNQQGAEQVSTDNQDDLWSISRDDMDSFTSNEKGELEHVVYLYPPDPTPRIPVFAGPNDDARERAGMMLEAINNAIIQKRGSK